MICLLEFELVTFEVKVLKVTIQYMYGFWPIRRLEWFSRAWSCWADEAYKNHAHLLASSSTSAHNNLQYRGPSLEYWHIYRLQHVLWRSDCDCLPCLIFWGLSQYLARWSWSRVRISCSNGRFHTIQTYSCICAPPVWTSHNAICKKKTLMPFGST